MDTKTTPKKKIIRTRINLQRRLMNKEQLEEHLKNLKHEANQRYYQKKTANVVRKWKRPYDIKVEELEKKLMDMDLLLKSQGKQITNDSPITKPTDKINVSESESESETSSSESESESETSSSETETKRVSKKVKFISNNPIQQPQINVSESESESETSSSESESESETSSSETETKRVSKKVKLSNNPIQQPQQQYTPPQRQQYTPYPQQQYTPPQRQQYTPYPQQQYTPYQQQQRQVMFV